MVRAPKKSTPEVQPHGTREYLPRAAKETKEENPPPSKAASKNAKTKTASTRSKSKSRSGRGRAGKHPPYYSMIVRILKSEDGELVSSRRIAATILETYPSVSSQYRRYIKDALQKGVDSRELVQSGQSFRLSAARARRTRSKSSTKETTPKKSTTPKRSTTKKADKEKEKEKEKEKTPKENPKKRTSRTSKQAERAPEALSSEESSEESAPEKSKKSSSTVKRKLNMDDGQNPSTCKTKYDHVWQFKENNGKFMNYDPAASDIVEAIYLDYQKNPGNSDVRAVRSGQWEYMVDFMAMKQTNTQHENHTTREIRRVPKN